MKESCFTCNHDIRHKNENGFYICTCDIDNHDLDVDDIKNHKCEQYEKDHFFDDCK